ncbi:heme biosynthesis protein HemY [Vibrio sonorensis]|uniref:heme biosynthesis protein HemY n=1 Tax=Vibrio sonorensis TaxID=1004316 RepID=UPI0008DA6081|nr:heme biosynthesis HemY N-terminal domain-containing protein [Vibrio sonorensis]
MFRFVFLFVVLGAGLFAGTQFAGHQGYVLINVANKTIEMSVTTLVVFVIAALAGLFALEYLIKKALSASSATWNWFSVRKMRRSRRYTNEGIIKLLEGDFKLAEKKVTKWAKHHDMPLLCYLVASEAAQGQGNKELRDKYLALASEQENSELAVELTRAKQQVRECLYSEAFDTLTTLKHNHANNAILLNLLKTVYIELKLWQPLIDVLPQLLKTKCIDKDEKQRLMQLAQCGLLEDIALQQGSEGLIKHWNGLPRAVKKDTHLVTCFAKQLIARNADHEAFTIVKETLKKHPNAELYQLLTKLKVSDTHPVVTLLENTLRKDGNNAEAHSAIGQLKLRNSEWTEAQQHLEKALSLRSSVSDYASLADALEKQNLSKAASEVSRKALSLAQQ